MTIEFRAVGFTMTGGLAQRIGRAFHRLETDFSQLVRSLHVRLSDINGPHGGDDKRCFVEIELPRARRALIEETDADMYAAIDRAAERAFQAVAREAERCSRRARVRAGRRASHAALKRERNGGLS